MGYHIPTTNVYYKLCSVFFVIAIHHTLYIVMVLAQGCRDWNAFGFELYVMYMYTFGFIILLYVVV